MGKFFGSIAFFLVAIFLVYLLNLPAAEIYASNYSEFAAPYVIAVLELLHHPFEHLWVIPSWLIAGFLGGIFTRSWKGAIIVSLITGFILSLTWIFFMWRYSPVYWNTFTTTHSTLDVLGQTLGMGLLLGIISAGPGILGGHVVTISKQTAQEQTPIKKIQTKCPKCGTIFQSKPKFCYKCNTLLDSSVKIE